MNRLIKRLMLGGTAAALIGVGAIAYAQHGAVPAPDVHFTARQQALPFELFRGNRIIVQGTLNGRLTPIMLDSGASATTLDRAYARSIGLPPGTRVEARGAGGVVEAELVSNVTIEVGGMRFDKMTVAVMDLQFVARGIGRPINVVLGREFFNSAVVTIDWAASALTISSPQSFQPPSDARVVELGRTGPFNTVPLSVAGGPSLTALLDVGNGGNVILPANYWKQRPELARLRFAESQAGGVGGVHPVRAVTLPSVSFGGRSFAQVPATLSEKAESGHATEMPNVGIGMLKPFRVSLDLGRSRLYLSPAEQPQWLRDRSGVRTDLAGDRLKVTFVSPGGPAARVGLRIGDEIVAVDGRAVDSNYYAGQDWARGAAGTAVRLSRADGSFVTVTLADYF